MKNIFLRIVFNWSDCGFTKAYNNLGPENEANRWRSQILLLALTWLGLTRHEEVCKKRYSFVVWILLLQTTAPCSCYARRAAATLLRLTVHMAIIPSNYNHYTICWRCYSTSDCIAAVFDCDLCADGNFPRKLNESSQDDMRRFLEI